MIGNALRDGSAFFEWTHKRIGGAVFPATVLLTKLETKGNVLVQATVRDITEQKQLEEKLRASNDSLRLKVDEMEAFKKFTVDRELRMVELKNELTALKEKLKNHG